MPPALYAELTPWYHLVDPPEDHADEAACFLDAFADAIVGPSTTLLELGSGAGNNAWHLKARFACTLTDIAEPMLALSRMRNPGCEHVAGDMRTLRLGRTFDAVLAHDGITYMTTEPDLRAAIETAFVHTRPGGAAIFTPDDLADTFVEGAQLLEGHDGDRSLRCIEWSWDPVPGDDKARVEYGLLMRERGEVRSFHDRHETGLFPRATWLRLLQDAGFVVDVVRRPIADDETDEVFLCRRPWARRDAPSGSGREHAMTRRPPAAATRHLEWVKASGPQGGHGVPPRHRRAQAPGQTGAAGALSRVRAAASRWRSCRCRTPACRHRRRASARPRSAPST